MWWGGFGQAEVEVEWPQVVDTSRAWVVWHLAQTG